MKSIVFSFKKRKSSRIIYRSKISFTDFVYFIKRYGIQTAFIAVFFLGLVFGSLYAGNADKTLLDSLDFLFTTNFDARLSQNFVGTFCACFASDFIFLLAVFFVGITPWGIPVLPFILLFKGFGTGLTAGYLFITYSLKGAGFYFIILLPGTFLFCLSLVLLSSSAYTISKQMFFCIIEHSNNPVPMYDRFIKFCSNSLSALIMTFFAALTDAALWTLFAGTFNF